MSEYEKYYKESLYPFQDGILTIVKRISVPFYPIGGTALIWHYSPVRYSDDLDLFVNAVNKVRQRANVQLRNAVCLHTTIAE